MGQWGRGPWHRGQSGTPLISVTLLNVSHCAHASYSHISTALKMLRYTVRWSERLHLSPPLPSALQCSPGERPGEGPLHGSQKKTGCLPADVPMAHVTVQSRCPALLWLKRTLGLCVYQLHGSSTDHLCGNTQRGPPGPRMGQPQPPSGSFLHVLSHLKTSPDPSSGLPLA